MFGWSSSCLISISCLEQVVKEGELREATKTPTTTLNELNASSAETGDTTHPATVAQHLHHAEGKCVTSGVHWRHVGDRRVKKVRSQNQEPGPDLDPCHHAAVNPSGEEAEKHYKRTHFSSPAIQ